MKVLIVGLGSMGKRRIRCLEALGFAGADIAGFDLREDRRAEVAQKHGVSVFAEFDSAIADFGPDALVISVPPDVHHLYMTRAAELKLPYFVEASVVDNDMEQTIRQRDEAGIVAAPSATLLFHPAVSRVKELVESGRLGKISNILHHAGQYLPDWHTYEGVDEYYVSNPATSGGREIVPFELTWLVGVFGFPRRVAGMFRKTIDIKGAEEIDDTYNCLLDYGDHLLNLSVDVVSRAGTRRLLINGDRAQLRWDWDEGEIRIFDPETGKWEAETYEMMTAADGYNANIGDNMYIEELGRFLAMVRGEATFPNSLEKDLAVLRTLYAIEKSDREGRFVDVDFAPEA